MTGCSQLGIVRVLAKINAACLNERNDGSRHRARVVQHIRDRLTDDVVKREENQQRDERPEAAASHRDALFLIHLLDGHLGFLAVVAVFCLDGTGQRGKTGHFEHALFALDAHRKQNELDDQREQNQRHAVVAREDIQPVEQIAERDADDIGQTRGVLGFRRSLLGRSLGAQSCGFSSRSLGGIVAGNAGRQ